ncbi:MAG: type II toxin-antitoxin system VapC family toxin [Methylocystis sp.]|nr:type II toxin-antitoxin system VapC family toxin [Methylocystis sp.]
MRLLLDTHIMLALPDGEVHRFGNRVETLLRDADSLHVSAASLWEMAIKYRLGKLPLSAPLDVWPATLTRLGVDLIPVIANHVLADIDPEPPTRDPFDRLLLAQCKTEGRRLVTVDWELVGHLYAVTE